MKYRPPVALSVLAVSLCLLSSRKATAQPQPAQAQSGSAASSPSASSPSKETPEITIPGPLRSFLRMAALSQKVSPREVLPLLSRNIVIHGYHGTQDKPGKATEYLVLLKRYMDQARELQALAGQAGVIRVADCSQAKPLLAIIGYQLNSPCGRTVSVETEDPERAFITIDSGFPLADLEETLRGGKPFEYPYTSSKVPTVLTETHWTEDAKSKKDDDSDSLLDTLLGDPAWARLYWAMARMDPSTRAVLQQTVGLRRLLKFSPVLDFYGNYIAIRSGHVVVPGGAPSEPVWKVLAGVAPSSAGEFVVRLLEKDEGWLAAYFDCLSRLPRDRQAYYTDPRRLQRFYEALRGDDLSPSPSRPVFRPDPGLLLLMTRLRLDEAKQPVIPGNVEAWKQILEHHDDSGLVHEWARRARRWNNPEQVVEGMIGMSRVRTDGSPLQMFLAMNEIDRARSPQQRLSAQNVLTLADKFQRFSNQYRVFAEFPQLDNDSISRFISVAEALDRIPNRVVRGNAVGIFQANLGLWQVLARQGQIPESAVNNSWQRVIDPFASIGSAAQLFDATQSSLGDLMRAAGGSPDATEDDIISMLAGPSQSGADDQRIRQELAGRMHSVLDSQRLVSIDTLVALGKGLNRAGQEKGPADDLISLAAQLREFEMPKPMFTAGERYRYGAGRQYNNRHTILQMQTDLVKLIKSKPQPKELAEARGQITPFLRDSLVGLNYAYYELPGAQMLHNNPLFIRSHDFSGETTLTGEQAWQTPRIFGSGEAAGGGAHLVGSLADLPYVLAQAEQDFIVPESVQALIWQELVPTLLTSAILPRWWGVSSNEMHAVALYQQAGEELLAASTKDEALRQTVLNIVADGMTPERAGQIEEQLQGDRLSELVPSMMPSETFFLAAEFRRRFPGETAHWGHAGKELEDLGRRSPNDIRPEQLSKHFGVPHPVLAQSYGRELLNMKPFPAFMGYASRLLAESWDSNNLYWARLADERGYAPAILNRLVPQLTHRMIEKVFATDFEDWPALLRAMRETGDEFQRGKITVSPANEVTAQAQGNLLTQ